MISHGRTCSFCLNVLFQLSSSVYLWACNTSARSIAGGKSLKGTKVFRDAFVCMLSMQFTCCTQIMILGALYSSYRALDGRMWIRDRFQNSDPGSEMYDLLFCKLWIFILSSFSFWRFMIMLSLMYFCFACMSVHVQFSMIHASSDLLCHRTCSILERCFVQACQ